jgi:hypothetical protein
MMIKHRGTVRTIYSSIDSWKFREAFPLILTHEDSSLRVSQQIRGPNTPPNGKKKPAKAERWQSIDQFLSLSDNTTLFSSMISIIY